MLLHLSITDLALIEQLELSFEAGLTVLTGETGAGKSIAVGALELLLGGRAKPDLIRFGKERAEISGQWKLSSTLLQSIEERLKAHALHECEDGILLIKRVLSRKGRGRQSINGSMLSLSQLKEVTHGILDFTGQSSQLQLTKNQAQRKIVDAYANAEKELTQVKSLYFGALKLQKEQKQILALESQKAERMEWLKFQLAEIQHVAPEENELDDLIIEREKLQNISRFKRNVGTALRCMDAPDNGALTQTQKMMHALKKIGSNDTELEQIQSVLLEASCLLEDASHSLNSYMQGLSLNPNRLAFVEDRFHQLKSLCKKYGGSIEGVLMVQERLETELDTLEGSEEQGLKLEDQKNQMLKELKEAAQKLTLKRRRVKSKLENKIKTELVDLGMKDARIEIQMKECEHAELEISPVIQSTGAENIDFHLIANKGEKGGSLAKVASGGELSRIMLALKGVLLEKDPVPVSLFDEVDSGVGGAIAEIIGEKLEAIAKDRQVICITHLAQIAAKAEHHLLVAKRSNKTRTVTTIKPLNKQGRTDELARMLGGKKITETIREHAKEISQRSVSFVSG